MPPPAKELPSLLPTSGPSPGPDTPMVVPNPSSFTFSPRSGSVHIRADPEPSSPFTVVELDSAPLLKAQAEDTSPPPPAPPSWFGRWCGCAAGLVEGCTTHWTHLSAAFFFAFSSILIMFVNKLVLTSYGFPSSNVLAASQYVCTLVICTVLKSTGMITFADSSWQTFKDMMPLSLLFFCNALSGLGGTKKVNLPMFTVLRRFTILFTMVLEGLMLGKGASAQVQLSVFFMIGGSFVAASRDLTFDLYGYIYILLNDIFTALSGVVTKQKTELKHLGEWGVLFYNSLYSFPFVLLAAVYDRAQLQQVLSFPLWTDPSFLCAFAGASIMGCVLQYATVRCTKVNSALTTNVVGCLKNVATTYVGMFMVDYRFNMVNFTGLNISILGSIYYSVVRMREQEQERQKKKQQQQQQPQQERRPSDPEKQSPTSPLGDSRASLSSCPETPKHKTATATVTLTSNNASHSLNGGNGVCGRSSVAKHSLTLPKDLPFVERRESSTGFATPRQPMYFQLTTPTQM